MNLCQCGCGKPVTKKGNKFLLGHNAKGNKHNIGKPSPFKGKTYKEIYGDKASEIKSKIGSKSKGRKNPRKGLTFEEYFGDDKAKELKENLSIKNTNNPLLKDRKGKKNPNYKGHKDSLYSNFHSKLIFDENRNHNSKIEVRCKYCNKWFIPTPIQLDNRIIAIKKYGYGGDFYCSEDCKELCPDYYQVFWPKNYKPYNSKFNRVEVVPEVRKIVFERDNWECQKCESTEFLECHHIDPVSQEPGFANDPDSCITLCKKCHKFIHMKIEGCKYNELRSKC